MVSSPLALFNLLFVCLLPSQTVVPIRVRGERELREHLTGSFVAGETEVQCKECCTVSSVWLAACPKKCFLTFFTMVFIYFWLFWVFVAVQTCCGAWGLSFWWLLWLWSVALGLLGFSSCYSWTLEHRFNSCRAWAWLLCGMWDLPKSDIEAASLASAGEFLNLEPSGKLKKYFLIYLFTALRLQWQELL